MLNLAIVVGALLLPVLVLAEIWRTRRVTTPAMLHISVTTIIVITARE